MFRNRVTYHTAGSEHLVVQLLNILSLLNRDTMLAEGNVLAGLMYQMKYGGHTNYKNSEIGSLLWKAKCKSQRASLMAYEEGFNTYSGRAGKAEAQNNHQNSLRSNNVKFPSKVIWLKTHDGK